MNTIGRRAAVDVDAAWRALQNWFVEHRGAIVLVSGGVDSSLLLAAAAGVLDCVVAVTAESPSLARSEAQGVKSFVSALGVRHVFLQTDELDDEQYIANSGDRCYYCKKALYRALEREVPLMMHTYPDAVVVDGTNKDDLGDHRPSLPASREHGIRHPFVELGFDKHLIRELARIHNLPMWNKPAMACLSSRIQEGVPVSLERLSMVERAEQVLREAGFESCRVRYHESGEGERTQRIARIELPPDQIGLFVQEATARGICQEIRGLGFQHVTIDLEGYKRGGRAAPGRRWKEV